MIKLKREVCLPTVGLTGFVLPLSEEESAVQAGVHRFAKAVMGPLGAELDKMSAEDVIAPGSPYWSIFPEFAKLGLDPAMMADLPPEVAIRMESLIGEELSWGDSGLGVTLLVAGFPLEMAASLGNKELVDGHGRQRHRGAR